MFSNLPANLRPREAAQFLGIGTSTFWRWASGREDFPRIIKLSPRTSVVPLDELIAFRDAQARYQRPTVVA